MNCGRRASHSSYPLFTIAIPTYNRSDLLRECLTSTFNQTYKNFEIVVHDNCSTDNTQEILQEFARPQLRTFRNETNIGHIANLNACLRSAAGQYIIFLCDDDRLEPGFLQHCADILQHTPEVPIILGLCNSHALSLGKIFSAHHSKKYQTGIHSGIDILLEFLCDKITVTMCSVVMRRDLIAEACGFSSDLPHMCDLAAWIPFLFNKEVGFVNEPCATFSYHAGTETSGLHMETRLNDGNKVVRLILDLAAHKISDERLRNVVKNNARRCFARRGLITLAESAGNSGLAEKLKAAWDLRRDLSAKDVVVAPTFFAKVLLPQHIVSFLQSLRVGSHA